MKKCSALLAIREMQIRTTMRHHLTSFIMAVIQKKENNNVGDVDRGELFYAVGENVISAATVENVWKFP